MRRIFRILGGRIGRHLRFITFIFMLGPAIAAANEVASARATYISALVSEMHSQDELAAIEVRLTEARRKLSEVQSARKQALDAALAVPQATMRAATAALATSISPSPRIEAVKAEISQLERQQQLAAEAAEAREAVIERLKSQIQSTTERERDWISKLSGKQTALAEAELAEQEFASLKTFLSTAEGLQHDQVRDFVWKSAPPMELVNAARIAFIEDLRAKAILEPGHDQLRWSDRSRRAWNFENVPNGDAWLLWDNRTNSAPELPLLIDAIFEQLVFLKVTVSDIGDTVVDAADLPRIDLGDTDISLWPSNAGSEYDACLNQLLAQVDEGGIRQLCQTLFPDQARYDVTIQVESEYWRNAILMSGSRASKFAELYRLHLDDLRKLARGRLPTVLLSMIQEKFADHLGQLAQQVSTAKREVTEAEDFLKYLNSQLDEQNKNIAKVKLDHDIAIADSASNLLDIAEKLTELQDELTSLNVENQRKMSDFVAREIKMKASIADAEEAIAAARASAEQEWASKLRQAEQAVLATEKDILNAKRDNIGTQKRLTNSQKLYLARLAKFEVKYQVWFKDINGYFPKICLSVDNRSEYFALINFISLNFRGKIFEKMDDLDRFSNGDSIFRGIRNHSFKNEYDERVRGIRPGSKIEDCSRINAPKKGELGRYFDSIGGFDQREWSVVLGPAFGTFEVTQKTINIQPHEKIFFTDLVATRLEATAAYRSGAKIDRAEVGDTSTATEYAEQVVNLDRESSREVQHALNLLGYAAGKADGLIGARSKKAIAEWQTDHSHPATGMLTHEQLEALLSRNR